MRSRARYVLIVIMGLSLGACRQADGPMPAPNETVQEELVDVTRDLQNVASGRDPQAPEDLAGDLGKYTDSPSAKLVVDEMSERTATVLAGVNLTEQAAQRLAHNLWLSVAARELSGRQVETLQNDVQSLLMAEGVAEENAQQVAAQVGDVQGAVTARPRRWYELF
jgi:hypothetical protein